MLNMDMEETVEMEVARKNAEQDVSIEIGIGEALLLIETVSGDSEIMSILADSGYDESLFSEGQALTQKARDTFSTRAAAIASKKFATATLAGKDSSARTLFTDFRLVARALFKRENEAYSALSLKGDMPDDRAQLLARAQSTMQNARLEPYAERLSRFGYDEEGLQQVETAITELQQADGYQNKLTADAMTTTAERDAAYQELSDWVSQFRSVAKAALRHRPDLVKILEV